MGSSEHCSVQVPDSRRFMILWFAIKKAQKLKLQISLPICTARHYSASSRNPRTGRGLIYCASIYVLPLQLTELCFLMRDTHLTPLPIAHSLHRILMTSAQENLLQLY